MKKYIAVFWKRSGFHGRLRNTFEVVFPSPVGKAREIANGYSATQENNTMQKKVKQTE